MPGPRPLHTELLLSQHTAPSGTVGDAFTSPEKYLVWEPVKNMQIWEGWASASEQPFSPSSPSQSSVGRAEPWATEGRERQSRGSAGAAGEAVGYLVCHGAGPGDVRGIAAPPDRGHAEKAPAPAAGVGGACCHFLVLGKPGIAVAGLLPVQ